MSDSEQVPPRMVLKKNKDGIVEAVSLSFVFRPFPEKALEYISAIEVEAIKREARAEAFEEAGDMCRAWCSHTEALRGPLDVKFFDMAKEARQKGGV